MKKLFAITHATPSVFSLFKGIYMTFLLIFITTFSFSQNNNWEIGIGLRPLTLKEEPYSFIVKKFISRNNAIRIGASIIYKQKDEKIDYYHPYENPFHLEYNYTRIDKNLNTSFFIGLQYGKRKNSFYWYCATDLLLKYRTEFVDVPSISNRNGNIRPGDFFNVISYSKNKIFGFGLEQTIGVQYFINSDISISIEGGLNFRRNLSRRYDYTIYFSRDSKDDPTIIGSSIGFISTPLKERWSYELNASPLTSLIFIYHF